MTFVEKALAIALFWLVGGYLILMGWRGEWVPTWLLRVTLVLAGWLIVEATLTLRRLRTDLSDLITTAQAAVQGFSGPMRTAGENIAEASRDIAAATEDIKQQAEGGITFMDLFRGKK